MISFALIDSNIKDLPRWRLSFGSRGTINQEENPAVLSNQDNHLPGQHSVGPLTGHYAHWEKVMLWLKQLMSVCVCVWKMTRFDLCTTCMFPRNIWSTE